MDPRPVRRLFYRVAYKILLGWWVLRRPRLEGVAVALLHRATGCCSCDTATSTAAGGTSREGEPSGARRHATPPGARCGRSWG